MKRRRRPVKAITMIELGVAGILLLLLVLLVYWYVDGLSAYKPKSEVHQFISGFELEYGEDAVFRENKGDITVNDGDEKKSVVKTPLLYKGETKITIPVDMLLMVPNQGTDVYRINHFTTISENAGKITYSLDNKIAESYGGFLYDGEDLYVFLDDTNLTIGHIDVDLPASMLNTITVRRMRTDISRLRNIPMLRANLPRDMSSISAMIYSIWRTRRRCCIQPLPMLM